MAKAAIKPRKGINSDVPGYDRRSYHAVFLFI
nr:MAG TPA: hypothetical protein [Caudoviricetes sp.]DAY59997.1 MAG TPA: hypothetical protein [Caudoviricetes sp.]